MVGGGCSSGNPEREAVDDFIAFAREPSDETWSELRLAKHVRLGLRGRLFVRRSANALRDPEAWKLQADLWRAAVGPFSALELVAEGDELAYRPGESERCVSPGGSGDIPGTRRWTIEPRETESCLQWFSVEVQVSDDGEIAAFTLDQWEP